ncbi:MAG: sulfotransferase [Phycisphaerae bacterium]|jgi:hypothetical protein|nr:sulfotransferase [Phycisphaerae bacterium]
MDRDILLILGCQRSGTTLMQGILDRDMRSKIYGEFSKLSSNDREFQIRLNPLDSVRKTIERDRAELIVLKPIVESQNALKLLAAFENARILWMYRDFRDAAMSNINTFGPNAGIYDLQCVLDNCDGDWRAEDLSDDLRAVAAENFSPDMDPHDAAALFWFVRNSWFFELNLHTSARVMLLRYEHLVAEPAAAVKELYGFLGRNFPGERILPPIHQDSTGQGANLKLSDGIERLCADLLARIDAIAND